MNVVWDLAPHDIAIMDYVIGDKPSAVVATGSGHFNRGLERHRLSHLFTIRTISSPTSTSTGFPPSRYVPTLIGGEKKMLVWNDLEPDEKIKIYDKGVDITTVEGKYNLLVNYRSGDMWAPKTEQT